MLKSINILNSLSLFDNNLSPLAFQLMTKVSDWSQVDIYGTQQPIAFLKLLLERGGCYDRGKDLNWKQLRDLNWVAAMGKPGGGRNEVDPRFLSLFSIFTLTFPEMKSLFHIYNSMLSGHFASFKEDIRDAASTITNMTLEMYKWVTSFVFVLVVDWPNYYFIENLFQYVKLKELIVKIKYFIFIIYCERILNI